MKDKVAIKKIHLLNISIAIITIVIGAQWSILVERGAIYNVLLLPIIAGIIGLYKGINTFHELVDEE